MASSSMRFAAKIAIIPLFAAALSSRAELVAYEGFNHEPDANVTVGWSGGVPVADFGFASGWAFTRSSKDSPAAIYASESNGPSHGGVATSGNYAGHPRGASRSLAAKAGGAGVVWVGLFMKPAQKASSKFALVDSASGNAERLSVSFNSVNNSQSFIRFNGEETAVRGSYAAWTFFLLKVEFGNSATTSSLWINPDLSSGEGGLGTPDGTDADNGTWQFDKIESGTAGAQFTYVDEIRIGTTLRDATVTTEPFRKRTIFIVR